MKRLIAVLGSVLMLAAVAPASSTAGPSQGGLSSDNVEFLQFVPFEVGTATGARVIGKFLYVTSWKSFSIYDISDPAAPVQLSQKFFPEDASAQGSPFRFENEDVATNGKILIFSEELPTETVYVYDVEDKTNPTLIGKGPGGQHTMSCVFNCKYLYGSDGNIIDLRDPTKPTLMDKQWTEGLPATGGHDVNEIAPGLVITSSNPMMFLDIRKDVTKPKLLAVSQGMDEFIHSNQWPNHGKDKFALTSGETWTPGTDARCKATSAGLATWDTTGWKKTKSFKMADIWRPENGTYTDGKPVINAPFGCSSHWFQEHPTFKNGGLVAAGFYNHGTRFLDVASNGKITETGWFIPNGGGTSAAYWITDKIVYAIDYQRGFDVLQYNGKP
jgi:hypothetical protein